MTTPTTGGACTSSIIPLKRWAKDIGRTMETLWRWRRQGRITVQNIGGRLYISREEIARFESQAAAGAFAKQHKSPARKEIVSAQ